MAQKESQHREVVDDLSEQLTTVRRQLDDLTTLNRDQVCAQEVANGIVCLMSMLRH